MYLLINIIYLSDILVHNVTTFSQRASARIFSQDFDRFCQMYQQNVTWMTPKNLASIWRSKWCVSTRMGDFLAACTTWPVPPISHSTFCQISAQELLTPSNVPSLKSPLCYSISPCYAVNWCYGSHGLSAQRARRTKSSRAQSQPNRSRGPDLQGAPRLLVKCRI